MEEEEEEEYLDYGAVCTNDKLAGKTRQGHNTFVYISSSDM